MAAMYHKRTTRAATTGGAWRGPGIAAGFVCAVAVFLALAGARGQDQELLPRYEPPTNPCLADSPWPITHHNSYQQGSSSLPGPVSKDSLHVDFLRGKPVSITLAYGPRDASGRHVIWGTTLSDVFKIDPQGKTWRYADRVGRKQNIREGISGAYTLVDDNNVYYVPLGLTLEAYSDAVPGVACSGIARQATFRLPDHALADGCESEYIVGLNLTYDGWLAVVTNLGTAAVVSRDFHSCFFVRLDENETVSNTLAVDEDGGIYVVSSRAVYRLQWTGDELAVRWRVPYPSDDEWFPGRLGIGSGTAPSLMGSDGHDKFVAIGDGRRLMHLLLIWRDGMPADWEPLAGRHPRVAAEVPVTYGQHDPASTTTDQSLLVSGFSTVVVSNAYGSLRRRPRTGLLADRVRILISNNPKVQPHGIEKFTWNPATRTLDRDWANPTISCPNAVPTMSRATNLIYFMGARRKVWTLEAVDWHSGLPVFSVPLSKKVRHNSYYAATEVGADGQLVSGAFGGLMRFRPE